MTELTLHTGMMGDQTTIHLDWHDENNVRQSDKLLICIHFQDKPRVMNVYLNDVKVAEIDSSCPVRRYVRMRHPVVIEPAVDGGYNARILSLEGCMAWGASQHEAKVNLRDVKRAWIEIALEKGWEIPEVDHD